MDGRTTNAKKFIFIVQSDDLEDFVNGDWTGFRECEEMNLVYSKVKEYADLAEGLYGSSTDDAEMDRLRNLLEDLRKSEWL